jgi:2-hydroxychromene-2-carboxylate isomerase
MLEFWFELASTYSYPAAMRLPKAARAVGVETRWRVFLLGPLFKAQQGLADSPFNVVEVKGRYMWRDMERICDALDLPLRRPSTFPRNTLAAARTVLATEAQGLDIVPLVQALYRANFAEDRAIDQAEVLDEILTDLGLPAAAVREAAETPEIKAALRTNTEEAADRGLFGSPSFLTSDGELFWGSDRLDAALAWARSSNTHHRD